MTMKRGQRICPACQKPGRLLPAVRNSKALLIKRYQCQSCHWGGLMFRPFKHQSRMGFYLTLMALLGLILVAMAGVYKLLMLLPD